MPKKNPRKARKIARKWNWTRPIRTEIRKVARKLIESEENASRTEQRAIKLKLELLEDCFNKIGNVKFP